MSNLDLALSVALGIGLAAATGFRLFLPLLILSGAAYTGHASLNEGFAWLGTPAAVIMLGTAAIVEIAAFYIPGVDNLLDTVATPGAVVAGTIVSAAVMTDLPPMVKWTAAIIAGGGVAGITQGLTAMLRAKSTVFTGGLGNSAVATAELGERLADLDSGAGSAARRARTGHPLLLAGIPPAPEPGSEIASAKRAIARHPSALIQGHASSKLQAASPRRAGFVGRVLLD